MSEESSDWIEIIDKKSGKPYYANTKTKQRQWKPPANFQKGKVKPKEFDADNKKEESTVKNTESEPAPDEKPEKHHSKHHDHETHDKDKESKPPHWREGVDPKSNRKYYYHSHTKERSWVKPDDFEELEKVYQEYKSKKEKKKGRRESVRLSEEASASTPSIPGLNIPTSLSTPSIPGLNIPSSIAASPSLNIGHGKLKESEALSGFSAPEYVGEVAPQINWDNDYFAGDNSDHEVEEKFDDEKWEKNDMLEIIQVEKDVPYDSFDADVLPTNLESYAERNYNQHKSGIFSKLSLKEMMSFTPGLLTAPILKRLNDHANLVQDATQVFRNITGYMGDRKSSKDTMGHVQKLCRIGVTGMEQIHDEIFVQIMKQTTNNDRRDSYVRGWVLFAILCSVFPPSFEFEPYLKHHLITGFNSNTEISKYAQYALRALKRTMETGNRTHPPSQNEIIAIEQLKTIAAPVCMLDGTIKTLAVLSQTNVRLVQDSLATHLNINNPDSFALYELIDNPNGHVSEHIIPPDDLILDVMGRWDDAKKENPEYSFRLAYRVHLFLSFEEPLLSDESVHLYFIQAIYDVVTGNYPVDESVAMELAAIQLQASYGYKDLNLLQPGFLMLNEFVSRQYYTQRDHPYLEAKILKEHKKYSSYSRMEAIRKYLSHVKIVPTYGCIWFRNCKQIFAMNLDGKTEPPQSCVFGVSEKGVFIVNPLTMNYTMHLSYPEILFFGDKENGKVKNFVLKAGNNVKKLTYQFITNDGREIRELMDLYIRKIVDARNAKRKH